MATNQDITVKLTLDDKGYIKGIKGSTKETEKFGKKGKDTFGGLGSSAVKMAGQVGGVYLAFKAVGKIVGEVAEGVKLYNVQARAETKLAAVLKATGNAAGYTSDELIRMAGSLQNVTNFGDEAIINAQSMLATFTKIGHEAFPEATKAVLDLSEVMDQDLKTSAVQIGKALNDPILGVTALGRAGIQFSQDQKAMIKSLVKSNDMLGAQKIILGELENQFGGVAQELSTTFEGTAESIGNIVGDIQEGLGSGFVDNTVDPMKELLENLKQTAPALNEVAKSLGNIAGSIASVPLNALNGWIDLFESYTAGSSGAIQNTLVKDMAMAQDKLTAGIKSNISPLMQEDVFKNFGGAGGISGLFAKGGRGDLGALRTISTNKELQAVFDSLQSEVKGYNEALKKHKESIDKKTVEIKEETDKTVLSVGKETASTTFNGTADVDTNPLFKSLDPNAGLYGQLGTLGGVSQEELAMMEENWGKINQTVGVALDEQAKQSKEMDKEHNQKMLDEAKLQRIQMVQNVTGALNSVRDMIGIWANDSLNMFGKLAGSAGSIIGNFAPMIDAAIGVPGASAAIGAGVGLLGDIFGQADEDTSTTDFGSEIAKTQARQPSATISKSGPDTVNNFNDISFNSTYMDSEGFREMASNLMDEMRTIQLASI